MGGISVEGGRKSVLPPVWEAHTAPPWPTSQETGAPAPYGMLLVLAIPIPTTISHLSAGILLSPAIPMPFLEKPTISYNFLPKALGMLLSLAVSMPTGPKPPYPTTWHGFCTARPCPTYPTPLYPTPLACSFPMQDTGHPRPVLPPPTL
jgi:hypothetical protein